MMGYLWNWRAVIAMFAAVAHGLIEQAFRPARVGFAMAKESGIGMTVTVDDAAGPTGRDISNDITSIRFSTPRGMQEVTGLDKAAIERILLRADGQVEMRGVFNDASNKSHDVFKTIPSTSVTRTVAILVSGQQLSMEMVLHDYQLEMGDDGSLVWTVPASLADGTAPTWTTP